MDALNLYPLAKPFRFEDRSKRTLNPFTVKNVAGALGVLLMNRDQIPEVCPGNDWKPFSSWVEDTRNLWDCYKCLLSLPVSDGMEGSQDHAEQIPDYLWAGNVAGFIYLAKLSWKDDNIEMLIMRNMIKDFGSGLYYDDKQYVNLMLMFRKFLWDINQLGFQELNTYEPQDTYVDRCRSLRQGLYVRVEYSIENEDYRKVLFVDIIAHILDLVMYNDTGLRKIAKKVYQLESHMVHIQKDLFVNMLCLHLKYATGEPSGRNCSAVSNKVNKLLKGVVSELTE